MMMRVAFFWLISPVWFCLLILGNALIYLGIFINDLGAIAHDQTIAI